ncbi:MAG: protease inhibitor I42 family protein [bacterium]
MKKRNLITLILVPALILSLALGVYAATGSKQIEVTYRDISTQVNGMPVVADQEPFIFEGRTFVPLRFVAQALGQNVTWDDSKSQVRVAKPLELNSSFNGKTVYLSKEYQVFAIELEGNATTGYQWTAKDYDKNLLDLIGGEPQYVIHSTGTSTEPLVGVGGTYVFRFMTKGQIGETTIKLANERSWETTEAPAETFELNVRINLTDTVVAVTDEDNGGAVCMLMPVQQRLDVLLKGNPTTGYTWEVVGGDGAVIALQGEPEFKADSEALGAPGIFTFHFAPQAPGQTMLQLSYSKSGEDKPAQEYNLLVCVY